MDSETSETREPVSLPSEEERAQVLKRYRDLVDQKHASGLSEVEQTEMDALGREIDGFYDDFYEPILADLRERAESRRPDALRRPRPFGLAAGEFTVPDDVDDPLPEEILRDFEGL